MNAEVEKLVAACEREFNLKRDRVDQLDIGLRELENSFDREFFESRREAIRAQIGRFEFLLKSARREMARSRETLEAASALRNSKAKEGK
jgi:hypothetical protein